jgi:hypothetical protein
MACNFSMLPYSWKYKGSIHHPSHHAAPKVGEERSRSKVRF